MIKFSKKGWLILIPAFIFSAGFIFLASPAKAFGIDSILDSAIASVFGFIQGLILQFIGNTLAAVANALGWFLKSQGSYFKDIAIVQTSWTVFRDFANMFFILILVIIAFATIFDLQNYNWKGLIAKFLVAALLINFSLVIGQFIINISTTLSNIMLNQFSDITANLAGGLGLNKLITATTKPVGAEKAVVAGIVSSAGTLIVAAIALLSMLAAFIFSVVRVPILWALLIISPLAWISSILPTTRILHQWWWKQFLGWVFFMPLYLFALMMGVSILVNRPDLDAAVKMSIGQTALSRAGNFFGFAAQDIFFYILTVIILVWGLALSLKASFLAGTGIVQTFGFVNKRVQDWTHVTALRKASQEKFQEVRDTGLSIKGKTIYGGERAERIREAKMRERFGFKGALSAAEAAEVKKEYDKYKSQDLGKDQLNNLNNLGSANKLNRNQILALRQLRAESGWVATGRAGDKEMEDTIRLAGENSKFAQDYINALKKTNFSEALKSQIEAEDLARRTTILPLKKAIMETMVKNNQIITDTFAENVLRVFADESKEVRDKLEEGLEKNLKNFAPTKKTRSAYLLDHTKSKEIRKLLAHKMAEDGEITTYQKYATAVELFGGEAETKSREMLEKIAKDGTFAHADILFRKELAKTDARALDKDYDPLDPVIATAGAKKAFAVELAEKLPKMSGRAITETDIAIWERDVFKETLTKWIDDLEAEEGTILARPGKKEHIGKGKRFGLRILKAFETNPDKKKEDIIREIMRLKGLIT